MQGEQCNSVGTEVPSASMTWCSLWIGTYRWKYNLREHGSSGAGYTKETGHMHMYEFIRHAMLCNVIVVPGEDGSTMDTRNG